MPRRWHQALDDDSGARLAIKHSTPGRSRINRKPLRRECRLIWLPCGCLRAQSALFFARKARGCGLHPAFPAPSLLSRVAVSCKARTHRAARIRFRVLLLRAKRPVRRVGKAIACPPFTVTLQRFGGHGAGAPLPTLHNYAILSRHAESNHMRTDFETLIIEQRDGHILVVTLNRPEAANALNTQMGLDLVALFEHFSVDIEHLHAIVLTGAGTKAFCAGGDLKQRNGMTDEAWQAQHLVFERMLRAILACPIPIIAAVNGAAYGGGCEIAAAAD